MSAPKRARSGATYAVGYRRPPRATQFKPGHSGNPGGRPRGSQNAETILQQILSQKLTVLVHGRRASMSKKRAIVERYVNKALAGENRPAEWILARILPQTVMGLSVEQSEDERQREQARRLRTLSTEELNLLLDLTTKMEERVAREKPD